MHPLPARPLASSAAAAASTQTLLILVGLVGCGKSTLANELEQRHGWLRCNQDELNGDRRLVERKVAAGLREGRNVVVDRTNFDTQQRAHFLRIAAPFPHVRRWCLFLDLPKEVCKERLLLRTGHPTLTSPEQAVQVLQRFSSQLRPPQPSEGFDRVLRYQDPLPIHLERHEVVTLMDRIDREGERRTLWAQGGWGEAGGGFPVGGGGSQGGRS